MFDEADMLLGGSYGRQMRVILDCLRAGDKEAATRRLAAQLGLPVEEVVGLPRHLKQAGLRLGLAGMLEAGYRPVQQQQQQQQQQANEHAAGASTFGPSGGSGGGGERHWQRQYVFVAATMPSDGDHSVGAELRAAFPSSLWLAGAQLHQSSRLLAHHWQRVGGETERMEALRQVVAGDAQLQQGRGRMLVFCRDVASAAATAAALASGGGAGGPSSRSSSISSAGSTAGGAGSARQAVLVYHRDVPTAERAAALARMAGEEGLVMVCTDAAARGLDMPDITHVVQVGGGPVGGGRWVRVTEWRQFEGGRGVAQPREPPRSRCFAVGWGGG